MATGSQLQPTGCRLAEAPCSRAAGPCQRFLPELAAHEVDWLLQYLAAMPVAAGDATAGGAEAAAATGARAVQPPLKTAGIKWGAAEEPGQAALQVGSTPLRVPLPLGC